MKPHHQLQFCATPRTRDEIETGSMYPISTKIDINKKNPNRYGRGVIDINKVIRAPPTHTHTHTHIYI